MTGDRSDAQRPRFNLATMSGVYPGVRTPRFQRLRLTQSAAPASAPVWAPLLWYDDPPACVLTLPDSGSPEVAGEASMVRLADPGLAVHGKLQAALAEIGYTLRACGVCVHWQPQDARTEDDLALGRCAFLPPDQIVPASLEPLLDQSALAPDCPHFASREGAPDAPLPHREAGPVTSPLRRAAAVYKEREQADRTFWGRLRRVARKAGLSVGQAETDDLLFAWADSLMERSGVGAGTEPCFACRGRMANLGALTVASPEDDKQTYSVWRCRLCAATYFNRWIDSWERLDNLQTDETYWRVAPAEAVTLLARMAEVVGGEHPAGRHERTAERAWFEAFVARRPILSHQIKLGR
ncbi:MAG: hypothetical protein H6642_02665 [Caldilineaceae bacterium]|nr:hypothetical protein [Caldilineaceae bacterium]